MVVFDEKDTGKIDYQQFAHCLKLWRQEKKDKKKWRQQIVLSADDNERSKFQRPILDDKGVTIT